MFLSKILMHLCSIIHDIAEKMFLLMIGKNSMKLHCLKKNFFTVTLEKFQNICLEIYELHAAHFLDVLESA